MKRIAALILGIALLHADATAAPVIYADAVVRDRSISFVADPIHLRIPGIGVSAHVEHTSIADDGTMLPPDSWFHAGWFRFGSRPGAPGNAVIAGHLDTVDGKAIFWDLAQTASGDTVEIVDALLQTHVFTIENTARYPVDQVPLQEIFGTGDVPRIRLVTCEGGWLDALGMYDERMIVTARYTKTLPRMTPVASR